MKRNYLSIVLEIVLFSWRQILFTLFVFYENPIKKVIYRLTVVRTINDLLKQIRKKQRKVFLISTKTKITKEKQQGQH